MKAVLALVLASIALSSALTITDPYYQAYEIYYDAPLCPIASISSIELYDNYDSSVTGGADINSYCYYGTVCTADSNGSYEIVCVTGEPLNLGVKAFDIWGTCDATTTMPLVDYYAAGSSIPTNRQVNTLKTWSPGCHTDDGYYYNFASVNAAGAGCTVYDYGYCGTASNCTAADCTTTTYQYSLASTSSGCSTGQTDVYVECATTAFVAPATKAELFFYDTDRVVFNLGYCGASSTCPTYWLGDGVCDSSCNNANCDYDCDSFGNCDCCVPSSVSSCCTPPAYGSTNVCCDVEAADQELVANNTAWIMVFEACLCDGINENIDPENSVTVSANGLCDLSAATSTSTGTTTTSTLVCDFAKVLSWCHAHALQDGEYTEVLGTSDTTTEWVEAVVSSWTTTLESGAMGAPLPECLAMGGQFTTESYYTGSTYYSGSVQNICEGIATLYADCDVDCSGASTLALSALFALVF